jgi:hypothetical protein
MSLPPTFESFFRIIRRRTVGGGPKSTGADEITWTGDLGSDPLILISRVRLNNPLEHFLTCASHRLRDSHVGRDGYWIDIRVSGRCSDADLIRIQQLAQEGETRLVVARRAIRPKRRQPPPLPGSICGGPTRGRGPREDL